ncbi:unnamed protein product [Trichobilharzia szidati]|nr:unnamed protein product [Trichobilharzia szidati]
MLRFVDYVVLVGYDFEKSVGGESEGRILQRFPSKCWDDYPYNFKIETFCQPCGWYLSRSKPAPTFFVAYLTDIAGNPYFAACLTFHEAVSPSQLLKFKNPYNTIHSRVRASGNELNRYPHNGPIDGSFVNKKGFLISNFACQSENYPLTSRISVTSLDSNTSSPLSSAIGVHDQSINHSGLRSIYDAGDPNLVRPPEFYAPKCLVFLARHQHFDVLKNSLSLLYTVFADSLRQYSVEQMIATVLGGVEVPPTGGPRVTFSLGTGDRQIIQPAHCSTIPVTRNCVASLFKHLGIHNVILLFTAVLSDQKVLVCSRSLNRLTEACHALTSILYPLKYGHTYVPILPKSLIEFVNAPTPFLYGIHSSYQHLLPDMVDVFVADLDGGSVACPENIPIPQLPDPYFTEVVENLFQILSPELMSADHVYPPNTTTSTSTGTTTTTASNQSNDLIIQDKKLRAVFLRLFASLFAGYRSCLTITRIHPQPVIHFNRTLYLLLRGNSAHNEFCDRLLSSMRFHQFILERGPPFRVCDLFDEEYNLYADSYSLGGDSTLAMNDKEHDYDMLMNNHQSVLTGGGGGGLSPVTSSLHLIERLSTKLLDNECGDQPATQILPDEAVEAHKRIHQTPFPVLDAKLIDELTVQYSQKKVKNVIYHKPEPRFVPQGQQLDRQIFKAEMFPDKYRVIHEFVEDIFNQHITEALKRRNTIRQDLKSRPMRRLFVDELRRYLVPETSSAGGTSMSPSEAINDFIVGNMVIDRNVYDKRAVLTWEQFELIVDLLDEALRQETQSRDSGITPIIMDLSTRLCTELENVRYYANMSHQIQHHDIWRHMPFWESVFNEQVNNQIRLLYIDFSEEELKSHKQQQQQSNQNHVGNLPNGHASSTTTSNGIRKQCKSPSSPEKDGISIVIVGRNGNQKSSNITVQQQIYTSNMSSLEIAAEEMRIGNTRPREIQQALETREESTLYAQIIHFINLIVNFRIPVHIGAAVADLYSEEAQNNDSSLHMPLRNDTTTDHNRLSSSYGGGNNNNRMSSDSNTRRQQSSRSLSTNDPPATNQMNNALQFMSQNEGFVKGNSSYYMDNYSNSVLTAEGFYSSRYSTQNFNEMNPATLLSHINVLENWLLKFVKNVGEENNLLRKRINEIEGKIKAIIESHLINLQAIYPKVQNIPHMKKPEIANPVLLPGEIAIPIGGYDCLSCQLLPDGRYERNDYQLLDPFTNIMPNSASTTNGVNSSDNLADNNNNNNNNSKQDSVGNNETGDIEVDIMLRPLLPAQGALFITNYRIIFTGVPKDPFQSNKVINRSFPISALSGIKKLGCVQMITAFPSSSLANPAALTTMTPISGFRSATLFVSNKKLKANTMQSKSSSQKYLSSSGAASRTAYTTAAAAAAAATTTTTTSRHGVMYRTENLDVILLRALTFQMLKIGFDIGEVQQETRDELRSLLEDLRYPSMLCMGFNSAPLGLILSRNSSSVDLHSAGMQGSESHNNNKASMPHGLLRMRHLKSKTNRNSVFGDSSYSASMDRDRRRTYNTPQSVNTDSTVRSPPLSPRSPRSGRYNQVNYLPTSNFPNCILAEEAISNLTATLKAYLIPPSISASSTAATLIDPKLMKLLTESVGYLDMVRFCSNVSANTASMTMAATPTSPVNYSAGLNDGNGSLNRSISGRAGSSIGSRVYCSARLVAFNVHHTIVKSYPSFFIIPQGISQNCLTKVARSHKRGRFPVVTWQHPETGAYLLRGSEMQSNIILNTFKNIKTASKGSTGDNVDDAVDTTGSHATVSKEHIRYIRALVDMSLSAMNNSRPSSVITSETDHLLPREHNTMNHPVTANVVSNVTNNKTRSLGRIGMFAARRRLTRSGLSPMGSIASGIDDVISMDSVASQNNIPPQHPNHPAHDTASVLGTAGVAGSCLPGGVINRPISLYILCEKQMTKMSKIFNSSSVLLSPIDYPSASTVTRCFKGFFKACLPNDSNRSKSATKLLSAAATTAGVSLDHASNTTGNSATIGSHFTHTSHHSQQLNNNNNNNSNSGENVESETVSTAAATNINNAKLMNVFTEAHENGWFTYMKSLLELAGTVVDLLDLQGASVALCLENGSDVVTQIVSLVQVMLDPYYRTIAGFWSLIDKEWLIFGHTFNQNLNQTSSTKSGSISPIFLQFLDAVHQLLRQFPLAFEFNDYYLRFLAYHHISNRFHNFKYDSEFERFTVWFPDLMESLANNCKFSTSIVTKIDDHQLELYRSRSIWPFIQQQHYEWPVFFNFRYSRKLGEKVLRPATNMASFDLWQFYLTEDLACGPIYDLDHFSPSYRKSTNRPYEPVLRQGFNNSHIEQTYAVLGLREGEEAIGWQETWEQAQSEILSPYSPLSPPTKHLSNQNKKPIKNIRPITNTTGPAAATAVATTNSSMSSMHPTNNTVTSNGGNTRHGVKALNKFSPLPSRFGEYREGSEPTEGAVHRKLMKSDHDDYDAMGSGARRRAMSSSVIDINPGKDTFQSSMTTSTSTAYQTNDDITQTTTLTPQGVGSSEGDLLCSSENNTVSPLHMSESNVNDPSSPHIIIVKDLSIEKDDQSQLNRKPNSTVPKRTGKDLSKVTNGNDSKYYGVTNGSPSRNGVSGKTNMFKSSSNHNLPGCEQISEDEAFHEGNDDLLYGDRYDSVDESSLDNDNHFTRHAILEYHRTATLKRLTRRAGGGGGGAGGAQHTHHDYKLSNGLTPSYRNIIIEYESDSVTSIGTGAGNINSPVQDEPRVHKFTSSRINTNPNLSCELCQKKCQSIDNVVKCIECDLFCHEKCSSLDSKCFPTHMLISSPRQGDTDKNGHGLLKRHDSAYLPSELDSYKKANHQYAVDGVDDDRGRSAPAFGITGSGGGGSGLFSPTLPWRGERDHSFRSSLVLIQDTRGKRKLSESSSSVAQTNTLSDTQSQSGRSLSGGGGTELPKHLASASYYGYLYKLGHRKFLQQWKQRLFALDTNRHQLKYYESYANSSPRGCIDLQDVRCVRIVRNFAHQRKSTSFVVFELETTSRTYRLGAINQEIAMQWIERIQKTIQ